MLKMALNAFWHNGFDIWEKMHSDMYKSSIWPNHFNTSTSEYTTDRGTSGDIETFFLI